MSISDIGSIIVDSLNDLFKNDKFEFLNVDEIFRRKRINGIFGSVGGFFNSNYDEATTSTLDLYTNIISELNDGYPKTPEVQVCLIDNPNLGAKSGKNKEYYIGAFVGTPYLLSEIFNRMMSNPNVLSEIGDSHLEMESKKHFNPQITNYYDLVRARDIKETIRPKDKNRNLVANIMIVFASEFLLFHEYAHIHNGHIDFKFDKQKKSGREKSRIKNREFDNLLYQTLEYDADCFATNMCLSKLFSLHKEIELVNKEIVFIYSNLEILVKIWLFSIYTMFRLYNKETPKMDKLILLTHPTTGIRQQIVLNMADEINQKKGNVPKDEFIQFGVQAVKEVESGFKKISSSEMDANAFMSSFNEDAKIHFEKIIKNWENVRPILEKFAYGKHL